MTTTRRRLAHRASIIGAIASLLITTSIALTEAPPASADPSARARSAAARSAPAGKKRVRRIPPAKPVEGVVNINTASKAELVKLPGIGPSKAERIIEWRKRRGKFHRVRDLRRVKGIGRMTIKKLARHLTVKGPTTIR